MAIRSQLETSNVVMAIYQNNPLPKCCAIDGYVHVAFNRELGLEARELNTGLPMMFCTNFQLDHGRH